MSIAHVLLLILVFGLLFLAITRVFCRVTVNNSATIANVTFWYFLRLLEFSGDIKFDAGPKTDSS